MIAFVFVVVVAVVVAVVALALNNRSERGIESGISSFRRELDALAPRGEAKAPTSRKPVISRADDEDGEDEVRTVQIGERPPMRVRPEAPAAPADTSQDTAGQDEAPSADAEAEDSQKPPGDDAGEPSRDRHDDGA